MYIHMLPIQSAYIHALTVYATTLLLALNLFLEQTTVIVKAFAIIARTIVFLGSGPLTVVRGMGQDTLLGKEHAIICQ